MVKALTYPNADVKTQWRGKGGVSMARIDKLMWHTTESAGWPAYPAHIPTLTFNPWLPRGQRWRQHHPINESASTLANLKNNRGTVLLHTNRVNVVQVEVVTYCDLDYAKKHGRAEFFLANISNDAYVEMGEFAAWLKREWDTWITPIDDGDWPAYPDSYGDNKIRLTPERYTNFRGQLGHMHAPGNDHGDPGKLNIKKIFNAALLIGHIEEVQKEISGGLTILKSLMNKLDRMKGQK